MSEEVGMQLNHITINCLSIGVACTNQDTWMISYFYDRLLRLAEVCINKQWGTVRDDGFD